MYTHIMVGTNDPETSIKFYDAVLSELGAQTQNLGEKAYFMTESGAFGVGKPIDGEEATHANGGTIGFAAQNKEQVDAWHAAGLANGGTDEGAPGKRPNAPGNAYGAYLRDPVGNKICAFCQLPEGE